MPDDADPDSRPDPSSEHEQEWYTEQWEALCSELGTSDPNEVLARVQTLKRQMERLDEQERSEEGLVTISEVEEVFRDMNRKIEKLRKRNAALAEKLEGDETDDSLGNLHQKIEQLFDTLGATTIDEARGRVQQLNDRLEDHYQEKETLVQAGVSDAEEAVAEIDRLRTERNALRRERDQLQSEVEELSKEQDDTADAGPSRPAEPDTSVLEAAVVIRDRIGVTSPGEAQAFTRLVTQLYDRIRSRAEAHGAATDDSPEDVVGMLESMVGQLDAIPNPDKLPDDAADVLGVETTSEAHTLAEAARRVGRRIRDHYDDIEFGDTDLEGENALSLLHAVEDQLQALPPHTTSSNGGTLPAEAGDILGIRTVEDAEELDEMIDEMTSRLEQLRQEQQTLERAGLSAHGALDMIESMEAQLVDLYHNREESLNGHASSPAGTEQLDDALAHRINELTNVSPNAADDLTEVTRSLVDELERVTKQHAPLAEADLEAEEAVSLIENMDEQLTALYEQTAKQQEDIDRLEEIEEVLGISSKEGAQELAQLADQMEEQLNVLYEDKEKLRELGLSGIDDAVDMIESMENQLNDLYEDKEALLDLPAQETEQQSTFEQLETLYAERQKLQQELGVSSADDVIEMVESLNDQLDDMYTGRDAEVDPQERHDARLWAPDSDLPSHSQVERQPSPTGSEAEDQPRDTLTMSSMEHQLESLYREKETLLHHGFGSADEAVTRLRTQRRQIDALQRENHIYERRFDQLKSALGTNRIPRIVEGVQALESKANTSLADVQPDTPDDPEPAEYGVHIEAASPFVDPETLEQLDVMTADDLDRLDVGAIRLNEDGNVEALNEAALDLPGLEALSDRNEIRGQNFFLDLAPSTNNNLFYGRFQKGQRRGEMDARFPYTFTSPRSESRSFSVHLYRAPDSETTWLLFRPA